MNLSQELKKKFNRNISNHTKLSNYSWFNLGGPAEYFFKPENKKQLIEFLNYNKKNLKVTILGAGSNTLIRDNGIKGVVIKLGVSFSKINLVDNETIEVGAAALDRKVSNFAKNNGVSGFEFLSCIPGSIGGAVIMNSGCYGDDISKILNSIKVINMNNCEEKEIKRDDIKFFYRGTNLPNEIIITSVKLKGSKNSKEHIEKKQNDFIERKKNLNQVKLKPAAARLKTLMMKEKLGN